MCRLQRTSQRKAARKRRPSPGLSATHLLRDKICVPRKETSYMSRNELGRHIICPFASGSRRPNTDVNWSKFPG